MTTARYLITSALKTIDVLADSQTIDSDTADLALSRLNDLLDAWAIETMYSFQITEYVGTVGSSPCSVGPTGDIVTPFIPTRIENGFVRSGTLDHRFEMIEYATYADILLKNVGSPWPSAGYYDANGLLYLFPVPLQAEIHIGVLERLGEFATLDTDYTLRPGMRRALAYSLAEELAPDFDRELLPSVIKIAQGARRKLKRSNHRVPQLAPRSADKFNLYPPGFSNSDPFDGVSDE